MIENQNTFLIDQIKDSIKESSTDRIKLLLEDLYPQDIAELILNLSTNEQSYVIQHLENEISAEVLLELEETDRAKILELLSPETIAQEVITELYSDDATDLLGELPKEKKNEVIAQIKDKEQAKDIIDLLRYQKDTAGGIMAKEFVVVQKDLTVENCVREMRKQAQEMERVTSVFVVNDQDELLGTLSLKRLLTAQNHEKIEAFYHENFFAVNANDKQEEVAKYIQKYDLYEVPVVDDLNRLVGTITVDDVLDVIKEEAEKDYQLASGISGDIDSRDSLTDSIKARLPWLLIGMIGGVLSSQILKTNQDTMSLYPLLILFIPLIGATAGNVGVQSSAIVVQGLANGTLNKDIWLNLIKEASIALVSGLFLSFVIFLYNYYANGDMGVALSVSMSLFLVVIVSASIGTIIPLLLNKYGIDPALATGPFITTSNDILGVIVYFLTAKLFLGI